MKSPKNKRILLSGYLFFRATFPYGLGEVFASVMRPIANRIVFMVLLLANFRYFGKNVDASMSYSEVMDFMEPILWSMFAVIMLPAIVELIDMVSAKYRRINTTPELIKKYCYILYGSTKINEEWKDVYDGHKLALEFIAFICLLAPVFLYYSWPVFVNLVVVSVSFVAIGAIQWDFKTETNLSKFLTNGLYFSFLRNFMFCLYLVICAVIIWKTANHFSLAFLFFLIVGMRMLLRKAASLASTLSSGVFNASGVKKTPIEMLD